MRSGERAVRGMTVLVGLAVMLAVAAPGTAKEKTRFKVHGFVGHSTFEAASGETVRLIDAGSGKTLAEKKTGWTGGYKFKDVAPGRYRLEVAGFSREVTVEGKDVRADFDLSAEGGALNYASGAAGALAEALGEAASELSGGQGAAPAPGGATAGGTSSGSKEAGAAGNDAALAAQIAGTWWGYQGSTERKIGLCPDGTYREFSESSYSGRGFDQYGDETMAWGAASQGGGSGRWTIQGNGQSGVIRIVYADGNTATLSYRQSGDEGCLLIDGNTLCRTSAACE